MSPQTMTALLTGTFGLCGVLGGVLLSGYFSRRTERSRIANADSRRWLADRRHAYAAYLAIVTSMLRSIDGMSAFLPSGSKPLTAEEEAMLKDDIFDFYRRWDDELQPALGEVQLLAGPQVAELADRTSWALMELNGFIDSRQTFETVTKYEFKARHLIDVTRNAMRDELGLTSPIKTFPMPEDWPWLSGESNSEPD